MNVAAGGARAAAAAAAIANAIKASGTLVEVEPEDFLRLLGRADEALVVVAKAGLFGKKTRYLTSYRGLAFYTETADDLPLGSAEVVVARKIWMPN
ncbi:MAG TPA: hypothetical protein VKU40_19800 [Thermoanaerobaculia bacterium]|nr:hypothetical protein [Thermoanaerobaculia bacterium]